MTRDRALLAGVLVPPIAWAVNLSANYFLASVACEGAWPLSLHVVSVVTLAAVAGGGLWSWKAMAAENAPAGRGRFMAVSGVSLAVIFGITILAQWWPAFWIEPCRV